MSNASGTITTRYQCANSRPLRVDTRDGLFYYRYNARGDVAGIVFSHGDRGTAWSTYGPFGEGYNGGAGIYNWGGAWGYWKSPDHWNFGLHDAMDAGLYYLHGRWYNEDTGVFLSPDDKGEYTYGSGQDAIDWIWDKIERWQEMTPEERLEAWLDFRDGVQYESIMSNVDALVYGGQFIVHKPQYDKMVAEPYANYRAYLNATTPQTEPFQAGREVGAVATVIQGPVEIGSAGVILTGGSVTGCVLTIAETGGLGCVASIAGSVALAGALTAHGVAVIPAGWTNAQTLMAAREPRVPRISPSQSQFWRDLKSFRGRIKMSGSGRSRLYYEWDFGEGHIEVYDRNGIHQGAIDPITLQKIKPAEVGRTIDLR